MREATLKQGLRFGVTTHSDRAISWMQPAHDRSAAISTPSGS